MARTSDEKRLLEFVPEDGTTIGNKSVRDQLGWDSDKYLRVRQRLIDKGMLDTAPGRGGAIYRTDRDADTLLEEVPEDGSEITNKTLMDALGWDEDRFYPVRQRLLDKRAIVVPPGRGKGQSIRRPQTGDGENILSREHEITPSSAGRTSEEEKLLALVPEDGTTIGNKRVRDQLGWDEDKYFRVRHRLIDEGILDTAPGRGGSIYRIDADTEVFLDKVPEEKTVSSPLAPMGGVPDKEKPFSGSPARPARVFIGSSSEGHEIAENIQRGIERSQHGLPFKAECRIWTQGVFGPSKGILESLVDQTEKSDFAILVLTPDDVMTKRQVTKRFPRDNVLFEDRDRFAPERLAPSTRNKTYGNYVAGTPLCR